MENNQLSKEKKLKKRIERISNVKAKLNKVKAAKQEEVAKKKLNLKNQQNRLKLNLTPIQLSIYNATAAAAEGRLN